MAKETSEDTVEAFLSNFLFNLFIQDDEVARNIAYNEALAKDYVGRENGVTTNFMTSLTNLQALRQNFTNFVLLSESFIVASADPETQSRQVAQSFQLAIYEKNGSPAILTGVAVYKIAFAQGRKVITSLDTVFTTRPAGITPTPTFPEQALQSFLGQALFGAIIEDNDKIFELVLKRDFSPKIKDIENGGTPLTFKEVRAFTSNIRKTISNRRLIKQSFVVNVGDSLGRTGQVAWEAKISGIIDGVDAIGSIVSVAQVIFVKDPADVGGHRQILMKNNVFVIQDATRIPYLMGHLT